MEFRIKGQDKEDYLEWYLEKTPNGHITLFAENLKKIKAVIQITPEGKYHLNVCAQIKGIKTDDNGRILQEKSLFENRK